jgi:hypothetical protein
VNKRERATPDELNELHRRRKVPERVTHVAPGIYISIYIRIQYMHVQHAHPGPLIITSAPNRASPTLAHAIMVMPLCRRQFLMRCDHLCTPGLDTLHNVGLELPIEPEGIVLEAVDKALGDELFE